MLIFIARAFSLRTIFSDGDLSYWVDRQYCEVDWTNIVANLWQENVYRELYSLGNRIAGTETDVFNEYMLDAYFDYLSENGSGGPATTLWNHSYNSTAQLPKSNYWGYEVLSNTPNKFLSNFVPQFVC